MPIHQIHLKKEEMHEGLNYGFRLMDKASAWGQRNQANWQKNTAPFIYASIRVSTHLSVCRFSQSCACLAMSMYMSRQIACSCTQFLRVYIYIHIHICGHTHVYVYIYIHICSVYTHVYIQVDMPVSDVRLPSFAATSQSFQKPLLRNIL